MITIRKFTDEDSIAWNQYVYNSANSTFYHQIGWKNVIEKVYGHEQYYLLAEEADVIKGILPLFKIGNKFVSLPFAPYGGVCSDDENIKQQLLLKAKEITVQKKGRYLEIRDLENTYPDLVVRDDKYYTFHIPLETDEKKVWNLTSKGERRGTKKAINHGLKVYMGPEYLDEFYNLYSIRNRQLGSPIHSYIFFKQIIEEFPNKITIQIVKFKDKCIGTKFLFFYKDTIISGWAASDTRYRHYNPNNLLTWEIIKYGCENNYTTFDFGRSEKESGTFEFKRKWGGAIVKNIKYQYYLNRVNKIPDSSKTNKKRIIFSNCWKKLPLKVTRIIGPNLRKNFP